MSTEEQAKIVQEKRAEPAWILQGRKNDLRHLSQNPVHRSVIASQMLNPRSFGIVREGVQRGSRNVIVDPIDRARIACARVRFEIVNTHASRRPYRDS